jgi:hypothetical protein
MNPFNASNEAKRPNKPPKPQRLSVVPVVVEAGRQKHTYIPPSIETLSIEPPSGTESDEQRSISTTSSSKTLLIPVPKKPLPMPIPAAQSRGNAPNASSRKLPLPTPPTLATSDRPTGLTFTAARGSGSATSGTNDDTSVRPERSKSMRVNILRSAFVDSDLAMSQTSSKEEGRPASMTVGGKNWPQAIPPNQQDREQKEKHMSVLGRDEPLLLGDSTEINQNRENNLNSEDKTPGNRTSIGSLAMSKNKNNLRSEVDDEAYYDMENELSNAASYRPVSLHHQYQYQYQQQVDSFYMHYASDSTDSDSDDSGDENFDRNSYVEDNSIDAGLSMRDVEDDGSNKNIKQSSSKKTKTNIVKEKEGNKLPAKGLKKKKRRTNKEKLAQKKLKRKATDGGEAVLTEREKSVARYRATIERIDRKLKKQGFGEEVVCVDGKVMDVR